MPSLFKNVVDHVKKISMVKNVNNLT